jgi:hypothetical protein
MTATSGKPPAVSGADAERPDLENNLPPEAAGARRPPPVAAELAAASGAQLLRSTVPLPPAELQMEVGEPGPLVRPESISEAELMALLEDAHYADPWSTGVPQTPSGASLALPSTMAEHQIDTFRAPPGGPTEPVSPPPDTEPAAARESERQLSQTEIDALLARLLGG